MLDADYWLLTDIDAFPLETVGASSSYCGVKRQWRITSSRNYNGEMPY